MSHPELKQLSSDSPELDWVLEQEREHFGDGGLNLWLLRPLVAHQWVYVLKDYGEPVAYAILISDTENSRLAYLFSFGVSGSRQGQGLGRKFLEILTQQMRSLGRSRLSLSVSPNNTRALNLYRSFGPLESETLVRNYYGPGEDRWLMEIALLP